MTLRLYSNSNNFRANKILIAAKYTSTTIDVPAFEFGKDNLTPEFKALNPLQKVPVLVSPQGPIFESNAILRYVSRLAPESGLLGHTPYENALVDQWIDFTTNEIEPARATWVYTIHGFLPPNVKAVNEAKKDIESALTVLDAHLLKTTYLVGEAVTLADITVFNSLHAIYAEVLAPATQNKFVNVLRWFNTIGNPPNVKAVIGTLQFAKAEGQIPKAAKEDKKAEKTEKPTKPAAAPKPADGDDDDDDEKPKLKPKNPLDDLPPSSMDMDTTKKLAFSQRPFFPDFFEQLWPMFDPKGYSWFTCHYKYNDENKVYFKTGNAVSGFLQRSDAARKWSFGVMNITGNPDEETPPFKISGAWMFRGPGIVNEMTNENPDSEYYEWKRIDTSTPEGQAIIKDMFTAEKVEGEAVLDRKYFK